MRLVLAVVLLATAVCAQNWRAGAAVGYITPKVNGTVDYVQLMDEFDETSPGTFVLEFDDGRIPIGNGKPKANWVRDHVRAQAVAIEGANNITVVFTGADVYMLFEPDFEKLYYPEVQKRVGDERYAQLRFLSSSTHNHHGPDTSGLTMMNRKWYEYMMSVLVDITVQALETMEPATLRVTDFDWMFGLGDRRDPRIVDPTVNVLQATSVATGKVIGTLVQWGFHPEVTLGFNPDVPQEECEAIGEVYPCSANGKYISGDFIGHLQNYLSREADNSVVLYMNGAIGVQIGPHGPVWEVSEEYPISGDGSVPPEGAVILNKNFRKALLIGRELAYAVVANLKTSRAQLIPFGDIEYSMTRRLTRMNNPLFRAGMAPAYVREDTPLIIGYGLRELYICPNELTNPSFEDCVSDNYETVEIGGFPLPLRLGNFAPAKLVHLTLGPISLITIPGELCPEVTNGVPADFDLEESIPKYYQRPETHALGSDYTFSGVLKDMLKCDYCWVMGLTMDAAGYMLPRSDFRISCAGSFCTGDGWMSGDDCKDIIENDRQRGKYSCMFGQVKQWEDHYEEILSASWDAAEDIITGYSDLLGVPASGRYTKDDWRN